MSKQTTLIDLIKVEDGSPLKVAPKKTTSPSKAAPAKTTSPSKAAPAAKRTRKAFPPSPPSREKVNKENSPPAKAAVSVGVGKGMTSENSPSEKVAAGTRKRKAPENAEKENTPPKKAAAKRTRKANETVDKENTPPKNASPKTADAKDSAKASEAPEDIWWSCPTCDYTVSNSLAPHNRAGRKCCHVMSCSASKTAKSANYIYRARMLRAVWEGKILKTPSGLTKSNLMVGHNGKIVPRRRSRHSKKTAAESGWTEHWRSWVRAHHEITGEEGAEGFVKMKKGGTPEERAMYLKCVERWAQYKAQAINAALQHAGAEKKLKISEYLSSFKQGAKPEEERSSSSGAGLAIFAL